jgi:hypothetical protein
MEASECFEEQVMEMEALEAIYPEEYCVLQAPSAAAGAPPGKFTVVLVPLAGDDAVNHVSTKLSVTYTPSYPEELPELLFESVKGLSPEQCEELRTVCLEECEENLGMAMVFTVCETAKQWMEERNVASKGDGSAHERMLQRQRDADIVKARAAAAEAVAEEEDGDDEEEKMKKLVGTPVTPESFYAWRTRFEAEPDNPQTAFLRAAETDYKKTGKCMFESGNVRAGAAADEGDGAGAGMGAGGGTSKDAAEKGAVGAIDSSIFLEMDDADMDGLSDLDDEMGDDDDVEKQG